MNSPSSSELSSDLDLTSVGSVSPPPYYPSPPPSQEHSSSANPQGSQKRPREGEDAPTAKKRRKVEPKPRTTQYLDLRPALTTTATDQKSQLGLLLKVLRKRQKIVVIAGAGISVSAGIPDFRSSTGLFAALRAEHKLKASGKHLFDASVYQTDDSTSSFHDMVRELSEKTAAAQPTEFHHLLATLASEGRLMRLYTQNVDGLDTSLPPLGTTSPLSNKGPWPRTVQLHGGLQKMACSKCNNISDFEPALFRGSSPPPCTVCMEADKVRTDHAGKRSHGVGKLRPRMVLYNEFNPDDEAIGTVMRADLRARPDAVIVVGTSMKIPGVRRIVREMCAVVRGRRDGIAVWINHEPPPAGKEFEDCWDLVVEGDSDKVAAHANMRRWDDNSVDYKECSESDSEKARANDSKVKVIIDPPVERAKPRDSEIKVIIETPAKKAVDSALLTPAASPRPNSVDPAIQLNVFPQLKAAGKKEGNATTKLPKLKQSLKATTKPSASKSKVSKPAISRPFKSGKSSTVAKSFPNAQINTVFKVSKPQQPAKLSKIPTKNPKPKAVILSEDDSQEPVRPMAPISPSSARNNGPIVPQQAQTPSKELFPSPPRQEASLVQPSVENIEVLGKCEVQTPTNPVEDSSRNSTVELSPYFIMTQNSPSRPPYEKSISPTFIMTQNSPSRPFYEKFVLPGQPFYPNQPTSQERSTNTTVTMTEHASKGPAKLLFPNGRSQPERQAGRPLSTNLVVDTADRLEKHGGGGRLKRMSEEIVSPTTIPDSMRELLN